MTHTPGTYAHIDDPRIKEGYRLVVEQDHDAEDPRSWGEHVTRNSPAYRQWTAGRVYTVDLERLDWIVNERTGNRRTSWEQVDSLGGNYLDSNYDAVDVAREHFPEWKGDD